MLYQTQSAFLSRCPLCGSVEVEPLSLFALSGSRELKLNCGCDFIRLVLSTRDFREFCIQLPCFICEEDHFFFFHRRELWGDGLHHLSCPETGIELGLVGPEAQVESAVSDYEDELGSIVEEIGFDSYFKNPQVSYKALNMLHKMAEDRLIFCQCGNMEIEVGMFPGKIELYCPVCGSITSVCTETESDFQSLREKDSIEMAESGYNIINARNLSTPN